DIKLTAKRALERPAAKAWRNKTIGGDTEFAQRRSDGAPSQHRLADVLPCQMLSLTASPSGEQFLSRIAVGCGSRFNVCHFSARNRSGLCRPARRPPRVSFVRCICRECNPDIPEIGRAHV